MAKSNNARASDIAQSQHDFFRLNACYLVAPESKAMELLDDVQCFLSGVEEISQTVAEGLSDSGGQTAANSRSASAVMLAVVHLTQMARAAANAAHHRINVQGEVGGGVA